MLRPFLGRARSAPSVGTGHDNVAPNESADDTAQVRFYTMTGGRSRASVALEFESMLRLTPTGRESRQVLTFERAAIADLCGVETLSVAEIAARLTKPIGVVRVVCGDLVADGVLQAFISAPSVVDDVSLITRLIAGVRAL
jgi:hypothetical protein